MKRLKAEKKSQMKKTDAKGEKILAKLQTKAKAEGKLEKKDSKTLNSKTGQQNKLAA